jgi:hypothetical protein
MDELIGKIVIGVVAVLVFSILLPIAVTSLTGANWTAITGLQAVVYAIPIILAVGVLVAIVYGFLKKEN